MPPWFQFLNSWFHHACIHAGKAWTAATPVTSVWTLATRAEFHLTDDGAKLAPLL